MQATDNKEEQAIWEEYWQTRNPELRNELAMEYLYIVKLYAHKLRGVYKNYADLEDMINQGFMVLLEAVEHYDPEKRSLFKSYASIRIKGAIIDFVRNQDWVTKRLKKEVRMVNEAIEELSNQLGRSPETGEIAAHLDLTAQAVEKIISEEHMFHLLSYEELVDIGLYGTKGFQESAAGGNERPELSIEHEELRKVIQASLQELTEKEKLVVTLYYYEELKKKDIAYILDISASRVCQTHSNAMKKMKRVLQQYLYGEEQND